MKEGWVGITEGGREKEREGGGERRGLALKVWMVVTTRSISSLNLRGLAPPPLRKCAAQNFSDPFSAPLTGMSDEAEIQT